MRRKGEGREAGRSRGFPAPGQRYLAAWLLPRRGQKPVCEQVASAATDAAGTNAIDRKMCMIQPEHYYLLYFLAWRLCSQPRYRDHDLVGFVRVRHGSTGGHNVHAGTQERGLRNLYGPTSLA